MTNSNTPNTNPDQNKSPVITPGNQNKTPEQLALDKKNEQAKLAPTNTDSKDTSTVEKKA